MKIIPVGDSVVSINHLRFLLYEFSKSEHNLKKRDVFNVDIQNFESVLKICDPKVIRLLKENVPGSEGTQQYLRLMYMSLYAVLQEELSVENRLYYLWYTVFFLRIWRSWILKHDEYTVANNFLTLNNYLCIEINAHGMYNLILHNIKRGNFNDIYPWMYGSQPAESFFRILRSLSPILCTSINCSVLEATYKIHKVEKVCKIFNKEY